MSSRCRSGAFGAVLAVTLAAAVIACGRETQTVQREAPPGGDRMQGVRQVPLRPGMPVGAARSVTFRANPYAGDPSALRDGERLYNWMNCSGCHFEGGGGMGPALMDSKWIYGDQPAQIFDSIVNGRPNGMPAFGDKLAAEEIWRIVAHVESLAEKGRQEGTKSGGQEGQGSGGS